MNTTDNPEHPKDQLRLALAELSQSIQKTKQLEHELLISREKEKRLKTSLDMTMGQLAGLRMELEAAETKVPKHDLRSMVASERTKRLHAENQLSTRESDFKYCERARKSLEVELAAAKGTVLSLEVELNQERELSSLYSWNAFPGKEGDAKNSDSGSQNLREDLVLPCRACKSRKNILLDLVCRHCGTSFVPFGFLGFLLLALFLAAAGIFASYTRQPSTLFIAAQSLLVIYLGVLLRNRLLTFLLASLILAVTSAAAHTIFFGHAGIPVLGAAPLLGIAIFLAALAGFTIYILVDVCQQKEVALTRAIGVLSIFSLLFSYATISILQVFGDEIKNQPDKFGALSSMLQGEAFEGFVLFNELRLLIFCLCAGYVLILALAITFKRRIRKPRPLFAISDITVINDDGSMESRLPIFLRIVGNIFYYTFSHGQKLIITLLNWAKIGGEYFLKYSWMYLVELRLVLREMRRVFLVVLRRLGRRCILPMVAALTLTVLGSMAALAEHGYLFFNTAPPFWGGLLVVLGPLFILPLFLWSLDSMPLSSLAESSTISIFISSFVVFISLLVSSLFLWGVAQVLPEVPFQRPGPFLLVGLAFTLVGSLGVGAFSLFFRKRKSSIR